MKPVTPLRKNMKGKLLSLLLESENKHAAYWEVVSEQLEHGPGKMYAVRQVRYPLALGRIGLWPRPLPSVTSYLGPRLPASVILDNPTVGTTPGEKCNG